MSGPTRVTILWECLPSNCRMCNQSPGTYSESEHMTQKEDTSSYRFDDLKNKYLNSWILSPCQILRKSVLRSMIQQKYHISVNICPSYPQYIPLNPIKSPIFLGNQQVQRVPQTIPSRERCGTSSQRRKQLRATFSASKDICTCRDSENPKRC